MRTAQFSDPKKREVKPKVAVVIPVFLYKKDYGAYVDDKQRTLEMNLKAHKHFKAGVDYQIILVNHGNKPLDYEGVVCIDRPNEGFSFGAWKQAWEEFGDTYEFYLFTEDDMIPAKDNWLADLILAFLSDKEIGAVGNYLEVRGPSGDFGKLLWEEINYTRDTMYNFDGSYTFTSSKILKQVEANGGLNVLPCEPHHERAATVNECIFQVPFMELGYKIATWDDRFIVHGSELWTGDVSGDPTLTQGPLMNINGRHKIPTVAEIFKDII